MLRVYSKALDFILKSAAYAHAGKPEKAAKALADALAQEDFEPTMDALDQQQMDNTQDMGDQQFDDQDQQGIFSKSLSRLTANAKAVSKKTVQASADSDDSSDDKPAFLKKKEEDAGQGEFDTEMDAEDVTIEHAAASGDSEDDASEESAASADSADDKEESKVMASANDRLKRQARVQANLAALGRKSKPKAKSAR